MELSRMGVNAFEPQELDFVLDLSSKGLGFKIKGGLLDKGLGTMEFIEFIHFSLLEQLFNC